MYKYYLIKCSKEHRKDLEIQTYTKRSEEWLQNYLETRLNGVNVYVEENINAFKGIKMVSPDKLVSYVKSTYGQPKAPKRTMNVIYKEELEKCEEVLYSILNGKVHFEVLYDGGLGQQKTGITLIKGIPYDKIKEYPTVRQTRFGTPYMKGQWTIEEFVDYVVARRDLLRYFGAIK